MEEQCKDLDPLNSFLFWNLQVSNLKISVMFIHFGQFIYFFALREK